MKVEGTKISFHKTKVLTAEQMRVLDARATDEFCIPSIILMENAGRAVFHAAVDILGSADGKRILVIAGQGNNGGDGFVVARHLYNAGARVTIAYFGDRAKAKGDALTNIEIAQKMGLDIHTNPDQSFWAEWRHDMDLMVDALLGTGVKGNLRPPLGDIISSANMAAFFSNAPVLAVDVPSGIDADTGVCLAPGAMQADATVTFALPKVGLLTGQGPDYVERLVVADVGIPHRALVDNESQCYLGDLSAVLDVNPPCAPAPWRPRADDSHKGLYGHVTIVAGSVGMTGAATLAAEGALRIGTGLVTVLVPESLNDIMEVKLTEAMTVPVPQGKARAFGMASLDRVLEYVNKWDAAVIGPGFGRDDDTIDFTLELIKKLEKPAIIDADALYAISKDLSVLRKCKAELVITPHPGEMATLLGTTSEEVQSNRLEIARAFAKEHNVTVVLKGAGTVIADPDGKAYINTTGSPGMATGGTGDVLSGMIGGLLAQRQNRTNAATAAVYLHGLAGEIAAKNLSEPAMLASDLANCIGDAILEVQQQSF